MPYVSINYFIHLRYLPIVKTNQIISLVQLNVDASTLFVNM